MLVRLKHTAVLLLAFVSISMIVGIFIGNDEVMKFLVIQVFLVALYSLIVNIIDDK